MCVVALNFPQGQCVATQQPHPVRSGRSDRPGPGLLTQRETECLQWVGLGKTDWEIGAILDISPKTVNHHVESAKRKLDVATRLQAVTAAMSRGLIPPHPG